MQRLIRTRYPMTVNRQPEVAATSGPVGDGILQEDGSYILTEDGEFIIQE